MHININHTIRLNYINSKLVKTIHNFKEETKMDNFSSRLDTDIHEASKDTGPPLIHLLPTYIRYGINMGANHTCNNVMVRLQKTNILKLDKT